MDRQRWGRALARQASGRLWVGVLVGLAIAFAVLSQLVVLSLGDAITARTAEIKDATPAAIEVDEIGDLVRELRSVALQRHGRSAHDERLERLWTAMRGHIATFARLEPDVAAQADTDRVVAGFRGAVGAVLQAPDDSSAHATAVDELVPAADEAATVLARIMNDELQRIAVASRARSRAHDQVRWVSLELVIASSAFLVLALGIVQRRLGQAEARVSDRLSDLDAFAERVAHDLKGPLQPVTFALDIAREDPGLRDRSTRALEVAQRNVARVGRLIDGLLAFARAGSRPVIASGATVDEVIRADVEAGLRGLAADRGVRVEVDLQPGLDVAASPVVLASIVENLARNAIVHMGSSEQREVRLEAKPDAGFAVISVVDTGPGIARETLARLFLPFERGPTTGEGSGLGLATVKRLVEAHGGDVSVESHVGRGSTFVVRLPRRGGSAA